MKPIIRRAFEIVAVVTAIVAVVACSNPTGSDDGGSDDGGGGGAGGSGGQMGGSVQSGNLNLAGNVTTIAGSAGETGDEDGTGAAARFLYPKSITTDGTYLYLISQGETDYSQGVTPYYIRKIEIATGEVTTLVDFDEAQVSGLTSDGTMLYLYVWNGVYEVDPETGDSTPILTISGKTFAGITTDGTYLYLTEEGSGGHGDVYRVNPSDGSYELFADSDDLGGLAQITTDGSSLFVADMSLDVVHEIDIATETVSTLATANLNVEAIACDGDLLYVAGPTVSPAIGTIDIETGEFNYLIGHQTGIGVTDGGIDVVQFAKPTSFTTDGSSLFLTDGDANVSNTIRKTD